MSRRLVPVALMRGGTSRGAVFRIEDVPPPGPQRDAFALQVFGAGVVDGLGGGTATTNKVVLVGPADDSAWQVDYLVGNVAPAGDAVDWSGTCGNMTSAVVPFALAEGLIASVSETVTLRNLSTGGFVQVEVLNAADASADPMAAEFALTMRYVAPGGSMLGNAFPTGVRRDWYDVYGRMIEGSLVDITHPYLFLRYEDVVKDPARPSAEELGIIEHVRGTAAHRLHLTDSPAAASSVSPAIPRVVLIKDATAQDVEITALSMGQPITSVPVTSAFAVAGALRLGGTVLGEAADHGQASALRVRGASSSVEVRVEQDSTTEIAAVSVNGTARMLLRGMAAV